MAIAVASGAPAEESKKDKRGIIEIGHNFHYEEPSLVYEQHHALPVTVEKHVPVAVKVPYPVHVEKHVPVIVEKKVPVYVEKKVHVAVDRPVPYPVEVSVPVLHKKIVEVAKPYPVYVEQARPVVVKDHYYGGQFYKKPYWG